MSAKEPLVLNLEHNEGVAHFAASGRTLAIGVGYHPFYSGISAAEAMKFSSCIVLLRDGEPQIRTPFKPGTMRSLVVTPSGFVAALIKYDDDSRATTDFFEVDLKGTVTEMPPLPVDLAGLWTNEEGAVFAYSPRAVFRWTAANPIWEKLPLDPAVNAEAIRKIVTLKDGSSLVVTDRVLTGFKSLREPPIFVDDLKTYPEVIKAYGDDRWWIVTSDGRTQKISFVSADGQVREVALLRGPHIQDVMLGADKIFVVCAGEGGNVHKNSYYVLNRDGTGSLRGPFMLPDDTMSTCIWGDSIVSGGAASRVYKTEIEP